MKKEDLDSERNYSVVKSNAMIQKARYQLSANQQKVILYTISKIKPEDEDLKEYEFSLHNLCEIFGLKKEGHNYEQFENNIKDLADKSFWVRQGTDRLLMRWFTDVRIDEKNKLVYLTFDKKMKPFLIMLKDNFTVYKLEYVLALRGRYSIRLYELLKSYSNVKKYNCKLEELKELLQTEDYDRWSNFKARVLDKAIEDINTYTDIDVTYETSRVGRFIGSIAFTIKKKTILHAIKADYNRASFFNDGSKYSDIEG